MSKKFEMPEQIKSPAAQISTATRRLPDGNFEAVAACHFEGRRIAQHFATAATRGRAETAAKAKLRSVESALTLGGYGN